MATRSLLRMFSLLGSTRGKGCNGLRPRGRSHADAATASGRRSNDSVPVSGDRPLPDGPSSSPKRVRSCECVGFSYKEEKNLRTGQPDQFDFRFSGIPEFQDRLACRQPARHLGFGKDGNPRWIAFGTLDARTWCRKFGSRSCCPVAVVGRSNEGNPLLRSCGRSPGRSQRRFAAANRSTVLPDCQNANPYRSRGCDITSVVEVSYSVGFWTRPPIVIPPIMVELRLQNRKVFG